MTTIRTLALALCFLASFASALGAPLQTDAGQSPPAQPSGAGSTSILQDLRPSGGCNVESDGFVRFHETRPPRMYAWRAVHTKDGRSTSAA